MSEHIPKNWKLIQLGEIASVISGGTPTRDISEFWGSEIPWVTPTDITNTKGRFLFNTKEKLSTLGLNYSSASLLPPGTILMTSRATVGDARIASTEVCTNQGFKSLVPHKGVDNLFLFYQMQRCREAYKVFGIGSTFIEVNKKDTERFELLVPKNLVEQNLISKILNCVDQTIEKTEALIHKYQQIKAGLMQDLFARGVTADGKLRPPREQAPELYKESPVGWIPREWELKIAGNLCLSIVPGRDKPILEGGDLPWITVSDIEYLYVFESLEDLSLSRNSLKKAHGRTIPKNAVIMSCVGTFGLVAITGKELVINQQLHAFLTNDKIVPEWLAFNLEYQERYMNKIATQTTIRYLNKDACESIPIVVPSKMEQQQLVEIILLASEKILMEQQIVSKLKKQKSGLMHDLLTGKVQVKVDKKEPAHV